jgi:hypothetical protein
MLFGGAAVVHREGIHIQRQVAAGQHTEVDGLACDRHTEYGGVDALGQFEPVAGVGEDGTVRRCSARAKKASVRWYLFYRT